MEGEKKKPQSLEGLMVNFGCNLILPIFLLNKGTDWLGLEPKLNVVVALSLPLLYGLYDGIKEKKLNYLSVIGFVSILVKGSVALFELPKEYVIYTETALPLVFMVAILGTLKSKTPLVKGLIYQDEVFRTQLIDEKLRERGNEGAFRKTMEKCTLIIAASMLLSAALNYIVATIYIKTDPQIDLEQFNKELGAMTGWSFLIIGLPTSLFTIYALYLLFRDLKSLTGLGFDDVIHQPPEKTKTPEN